MPTLGSQEVQLLFHVSNDSTNYIALSATTSSGNFSVNWGDGTTTSHASGATASRQIAWSDLSSSTLTTDGLFRQAIIRITPSTANLLTVDLQKRHSSVPQSYSVRVVEINVKAPNLTDLKVGSTSRTASSQFVYFRSLQRYYVESHNQTDWSFQFAGCRELKSFDANMSAATKTTSMFTSCSGLVIAPDMTLTSVTTADSMFASCTSLVTVPSYNLSAATSSQSMFNGCSALQNVGSLNLSASANISSLFQGCSVLIQAPQLTTTSSLTSATSVFQSCPRLRNVPLFVTSAVTTFANMFNGANAIETVPLFNTGAGQTFTSMFSSCYSLRQVPLFDLANATTSQSMFNNCYSLESVPNFNTVKVQTFSTMFQNCYSLRTFPTLDWTAAVTMTSMFQTAYSLTTVPSVTISNGTTFTNMFRDCWGLETVGTLTLTKATTTNGMFYQCYTLQRVDGFTTNAGTITTANDMFNNCATLQIVPAVDLSGATSATNLNQFMLGSPSISQVLATGPKYSINFTSAKLGSAEIESIIANLGTPANTSQTVSFASNPGATYVQYANASTTTGSAVVTHTGNPTVGWEMTGPGVSDAITGTSDVTADTITVTAHGLADGTELSFTGLGTTTGVTTYTKYFVRDSATDTFKVAATSGGTAIDLTGSNATVTFIRPNYVIATSGTNFTLSSPCTATSTTATLQPYTFKRWGGVLKGWTVNTV